MAKTTNTGRSGGPASGRAAFSAPLLRPATPDDVEALLDLARQTGPGFTSLIADRAMLTDRVTRAARSFADPTANEDADDFLLIATEGQDGPIIGCAAVKVPKRPRSRFLNYRYDPGSPDIKTGTKTGGGTGTLTATDEFADTAEVGSLFVAPHARGTGAGRLLAQGRYMLVAADPSRFTPTLIAELRGVGSTTEEPALWQALGAPLYRMPFATADAMVGTGDDEFVIRDTPTAPIDVAALPPDAQAAVGQCHPDGLGALKLLTREGFQPSGIVDLFDGGPIVMINSDDLATRRRSVRAPTQPGEIPAADGTQVLLSNDNLGDFRCAIATIHLGPEMLTVPAQVLDSLGLAPGQMARAMPTG